MFNPGFPIEATSRPLGFKYGPGVFGPEPELRRLDTIRPSLLDPDCDGPDPVYAIAMGVGTVDCYEDLRQRNLLFGVVTYAAGRLGREPVRSQGHVHTVSASCGTSTPELYEIWTGRAIILMQETDGDDPGRCFAVEAGAGEVVVVPPSWAHATISADPESSLTFGAWCVGDFGFDYRGVRKHGGLAWFPVIGDCGLQWQRNRNYTVERPITFKSPADYSALGLQKGIPIWQQYRDNPVSVEWVAHPLLKQTIWNDFLP